MKLLGNSSGNVAEVNSSNEVKSVTDKSRSSIGVFNENDSGTVMGTPYLRSAEVDDDSRLRTSQDNVVDYETFNYTAQNTGKFSYANTTMTIAWSAAGMTTNSGNITTTTTGVNFGTYGYFPMIAPGELYCEMAASFTAQPTNNTLIDFGMFVRGAANPYAPADGVYFRLNSAGLNAVINSNGTETVELLTFAYDNNKVYQFIIAVHETKSEFWIDDVLYARIDTPIGQGQPFMSSALPFSVRHAITGGAAGSAISLIVKDFNVSIGGLNFSDNMGVVGNRLYGSYQGLSGGTMGSLANFANSANPTAAVPTNTTAALGTGLGGQFWETDTLAVTTDGIIDSYQVPAGTANVQGKRLRISGIFIDSIVQTALTGGGYNAVWSLAFGHTAVSLATSEAATTKAPRRLPIGVNTVASGAVATTQLIRVSLQLTHPVYVNPGEFVAIVKKKVGTAPSAGVIGHYITLDYSWE